MVQIIYFSISGETWHSGEIIVQTAGNTQMVAEQLGQLLNIVPEPIQPKVAYPKDYAGITQRATAEQSKWPKLQAGPTVHSELIYLGFPNWFGDAPPSVKSWLQQNDVRPTKLRVFVMHEGSGLGHALTSIQALAPQAIIETGLAIRGGRANQAQLALQHWLLALEIKTKEKNDDRR
ncbi:flavodoxin family protein [Lacticaseibacillus saniviri]